MTQRSRNYCFTINNWTEDDFLDMSDLEYNGADYVIIGFEVGEEGTEHLQGYIEFGNPIRLKTLKKINNRAHYEARKGKQSQAIAYCQKDGIYIEFGEKSCQGKRTDLEEVRNMIIEGYDDRSIVLVARSWQAINSLDRLKSKLLDGRDDNIKPRVHWFYGDTGTGKTKTAKELCNFNYDLVGYNNNFFIGYTGNKTVIFDDFRGEIPFNLLLNMLDYGKCTINTKGGWMHFGATEIFITSSKEPSDCYPHQNENLKQLTRRIDEIRHFDTDVGGNTDPSSDDNDDDN